MSRDLISGTHACALYNNTSRGALSCQFKELIDGAIAAAWRDTCLKKYTFVIIVGVEGCNRTISALAPLFKLWDYWSLFSGHNDAGDVSRSAHEQFFVDSSGFACAVTDGNTINCSWVAQLCQCTCMGLCMCVYMYSWVIILHNTVILIYVFFNALMC